MFGGGGATLSINAFAPPETVVRAEPLMLTGTTVGDMLYIPERVTAVYAFNESGDRVNFIEGVDWELSGGGIRRIDEGDIYDYADYALPVDGEGKFAFSSDPRNPPLLMHRQVYVDYVHQGVIEETISALAPELLTGHIVIAGDSITAAAHTIDREFHDGDNQGYVGLLRRHFRNQVTVENFSFNGSTIGQLTSGLSAILARNPSTLVIAFGMNDHAAGSAGIASFESEVTDIVEDAQAAGVYVVLLGFFQPNLLWEDANETNTTDYNQAIEDVATSTSAAFVDIKAAWDAAAAHKDGMLEMTGDNFHHPNIWGQRVLFSAVLPYLLYSATSAAVVPDFIALPEGAAV